jgi:hypothetical protein
MNSFHDARRSRRRKQLLKRMQAEFQKLGNLVTAFEKNLESNGVKRNLQA